ncbi:histidine kinase [Longispora fulva]|uniref:histidine kinase n=1 Tax=Longispora fulva TaxID=619741 RepID=A0A8J7GFZ4_9ACTN|nr:sensor histidine kinase [Longispora fulva]MBG6139953.1 signal transduction histidine kinase [Longispora fulva]GIG57663.1 histidine kinase [Longispora fulva]
MNIRRHIGRDAAYLLTGFPIAVFSFVVLLTLFCAGISTVVVTLGWPVLAIALLSARTFADLERVRLSQVLGHPVPRPHYVRAQPGDGWVRRMFTPLRQGQGWLDLMHGIINFPIAITTFCVTVSFWAAAGGGVTYWFWERFLPQGDDQRDVAIEWLVGADTRANRIWVYSIAGVVFFLITPFVQRGLAAFQAGVAQTLLTRLAGLQGRISDLTESRAAAVSAEATALRKLERDIHDGPQQRLIRLAMELSRAQRQLEKDPTAVSATLTEAIGQTRETLDELRALSRGIAPPVLADRGLVAALSALAGRSMVPVELDIKIAERLPDALENALYFTAAESLTNLAKHSGATLGTLELTRKDDRLYLIITDNGTGGAHVAKGHGLAGLADRLRAVDGELAVDSPPGGPTVLVAEVPL